MRVLCLLLALVVGLAAFPGCGGGSDPEPPKNEGKKSRVPPKKR